ncbi:hypothetical protein AAFF_G00236920 [Aldrovandia affinis]|uniref:Uncharacterized protein n=1 Tax=Aldrovandia affinis TaxID=143900 RepID=A0AAD7REA7_9TELE|nr:hypothetical protein AAFF_G00236920 [Aldrovandia affinis]
MAQSMDWNRRKILNIANTLSQRYHKTRKNLPIEIASLQSLTNEFGVEDGQVERWISDVRLWSEDSEDLNIKRRAFHKEEGLRRLWEEELILVREMKQQWEYITNQLVLREVASQLNDNVTENWVRIRSQVMATL